MIDPADERLLLKALSEGEVVLVLGAGASATCTKPNGDRVLQAGPLARLIAEKAGLAYAEEDLPEVLSGVIGPRLSEQQFHSLLREEYTRVTPSDELTSLFDFTWRRLYTWNIDDAVENVRSSNQRRKFFNGLIDKVSVHGGHDYLQVIHLHGEASKPEHGFIFGNAEYNARLNRNDHDWYRELSADYVSHVPVFIGSRLKEPILAAELDRARPSAGAGLGLAFLVTPDAFTEVQLAGFKARNIIVMKTTLDGFVEWTRARSGKTISPVDVARKSNVFVERLLEAVATAGGADIEAAEYIIQRSWRTARGDADSLTPSDNRKAGRSFLEGTPPTWTMAASNVPVWLQRTESLFKSMKDAFIGRERAFVVYGQAGSGKTTALMQSLLRYSRENEGTVLYELRNDVPSLRASLNLISKLHKTEHVIVYVRDAFIFGDGLTDDLLSIAPGGITLVTSARTGEWREHIERRIGSLSKDFLFERFGDGDFAPLIDRLVEYVPAPTFLKLTPKERLEKLRSSRSQLLIALRETTDSERFTDVITNEFLGLPDDDCRTLAVIVGMSTIARSGVQESEARAAYERLAVRRPFHAAALALEGIVIKDSSGRLWARHELYVRHLIENVVDYDLVVNAIVEVLRTYTKYRVPVVKTVGRLDGILFKFLLNHNFNAELAKRRYGTKIGRGIYETFEVEFQLDGHFWLQYGQYLVSIGEEEEALSVLSKSIRAYSNNPYAVHAFADLQLRVAMRRDVYDAVTAKLIADAVRTLKEQHGYSVWDSDQYPMVTLAEKHVGAMVKHRRNEEARSLASSYYSELQNMSKFNSAQPLQNARERLAHYLTSGNWYNGNIPNFRAQAENVRKRRGGRFGGPRARQ